MRRSGDPVRSRLHTAVRLLPLGALWALLAGIALAQGTVSVRIMTDAATPADFGTAYSLGQLNNANFVYGPNFIIELSYTDLSSGSIGLSLSGSQPNFELAWQVPGSGENNPFAVGLGADITVVTSSGSGYYRDDGTIQALSSLATRYRIGARSTPAAAEDLLLQVTLTATIF
jgi:hypothetical protein